MGLDFSELLRTYRKSMGWTQEEISNKWSYSFETISAWERKKRSPSNQEIPRLAKLLGMDADELATTIVNSREQPELSKGNITHHQEKRTDWKASFETWGELERIYRTRTEFNRDFSYARMFENAQSIIATGISLNAIALVYSRDALLRAIIEEHCKLQLCFLDPKGKKCAEREEEEIYPLAVCRREGKPPFFLPPGPRGWHTKPSCAPSGGRNEADNQCFAPYFCSLRQTARNISWSYKRQHTRDENTV